MKINNIAPDKHNYLQMVADIAHAPETLYYIGTLPTERRPTLAIVGTIAAFLIAPDIVQNLLALVIKDNARFLPFSAMQQIIGSGMQQLSPVKALLVTAAWLLGGWLIAWLLFLRRDAN